MSDPLEEIYLNYKTEIFNYLYRSTLNRQIAEDLTQDTFLKAFKGFNKFRGRSSIKTWLFKIARNSYLNYIEKKSNKLEKSFDPIEVDMIDHSDEFSNLDEQLLIRKVLYQLPEKARTLIVLRDINSLSYREIAEIIDANEGQVKIAIFRARKRFKELYLNEERRGKNEA